MADHVPAPPPLGGVRIVELAGGVPGPFAGRLLADVGADVVKVEPPDGDPARREGPFPDDVPDPERSGAFLYLNTNKRALVARHDLAGDRVLLASMLDGADLVIEGEAPATLGAWGFDDDEVRRRWPRLCRLSVTGFGLDGPYAGLRSSEIVAYAMGGPMHTTGMPGREPHRMAGNVIQMQCGNMAALAALAALEVAGRSGRGVRVDVANFETQAGSIDRRLPYLVWHRFTGERIGRQGGHRAGLIPAGVYPAEDGYVQVLAAPGWLRRLADLLGDEEVIERFADPDWMDDDELPVLLDTALHVWCLGRGRYDAQAEAQALGLGVMALNSPPDVLTDPQFRARGFWQEVDHPVAGPYTVPGAPFRMAGAWSVRRPAPVLDEHGPELRARFGDGSGGGSGDGRTAGDGADSPNHSERFDVDSPRAIDEKAPAVLPLHGVRVLDLTLVWAGPYATMLLGDLGAEVIRVDNPKFFPTATRGATPRPRPGRAAEAGPIWGAFPHHDPGRRPWNRVGGFVGHARSKLGVTLDLRSDLGRETFLRLVERSDVLIENNSAKVLGNLGIGWDVLHARNPRLIVVRMPSIGLEGPYAHYVGFGAHVEALTGFTSLRGYTDLDLSANGPTYHMDPASGTAAAFATLAALRRRERTGIGECIELAQAENLLHHLGDHLVEASLSGTARERLGNRHPVYAPQGAYRCADPAGTAPDGRWVVLTVTDDADWAGLRRAMGDPAWAADERFATAEGRRAHHDELDGHLEAWTSGLDRFEAARRIQAEGVAAGPILDEADLVADPHLAARGFFRRNGSDDVGQWDLPGHLWHWDGPPLAFGPIQRMGADNDYVLRDVVGIDQATWDALDADGQLSFDFVDADGNPL
jgi:crotonobetainyl-CoA:carnitine CoA-transferase CaiB-like acyl-CoA transferase